MTSQPTPPTVLSAHPLLVVAIYLLIFMLMIWAAYQVRHRCTDCGAVPVFCNCDH